MSEKWAEAINRQFIQVEILLPINVRRELVTRGMQMKLKYHFILSNSQTLNSLTVLSVGNDVAPLNSTEEHVNITSDGYNLI